MSLILHPIRWWRETSPNDKSPVLLRLLLGGYMLYSGINRFIFGIGELSDIFYFLPIPPGWFWSIIGTVAQILCGAAIFTGVMMKEASLYSIAGVAILWIWIPSGGLTTLFGSMYQPVMALLIAVYISFYFTGPGALSWKKKVVE